MNEADEPLESWRRRLEAKLAELQEKGWSGRLHLYLDLKRGVVMEGGEEQVAKPWTLSA